MGTKKQLEIPLPKGWHRHVRSAMLHVISLAQYATVYTRSWAVESLNGPVRLKAEKDQALQELLPSPCARPQTLVAGQPGDRFRIRVDFHEGRRHLPIVSLRRAA